MKSTISPVKVPTGKTPSTPNCFSGSTSPSGIVPPTRSMTSFVRIVAAQAVALQGVNHARHEPHVGAGQDADADHVDVFLGGGCGHLVGGDAHAEIDNLHAGVAESAGDDLDATVVAVQAEFGEEDAGWVNLGRCHRVNPARDIIQSPSDVSETVKPRLGASFFRDCIVGAFR